MKYDELESYGMDDPAIGEEYEMYKVSDVDAAIAELKAENDGLKKDIDTLKTAWEQSQRALSTVAALKFAAEEKLRATRRALWIARAERASESHFMWCQLIYDKKYGIVKFNVRKEWGENVKQWQMLHTPQGWADVWDEVERKCKAKAEEYK